MRKLMRNLIECRGMANWGQFRARGKAGDQHRPPQPIPTRGATVKTILHQGMPGEGGDWLALPEGFESTYKDLGYATRELVLREDAEQAKQLAFNEGVEKAAQAVESKRPELAKIIRRLKNAAEVPL
jgi:hypothetical protein